MRKHWVRSWCKTCVLRHAILTRHVTIFFFQQKYYALSLSPSLSSLLTWSLHLWIKPTTSMAGASKLNTSHNHHCHGWSFKAQHKPLVSWPEFEPPSATTTNHSSKKKKKNLHCHPISSSTSQQPINNHHATNPSITPPRLIITIAEAPLIQTSKTH